MSRASWRAHPLRRSCGDLWEHSLCDLWVTTSTFVLIFVRSDVRRSREFPHVPKTEDRSDLGVVWMEEVWFGWREAESQTSYVTVSGLDRER